jgi:D-alanyl-D-alanine carboxypeptidase
LAVLAAYAMENPIFYKTVSAKSVTAGQRQLTNHNKLLWRLEGADGVKTGYTKAAGRILVSSATRQGRRLVGVTINAPDDWNDHAALLEDGFSRFRMQRIVTKGDLVGTVEIAGGQTGHVQLLAGADFQFPLTADEVPEIQLPGPGFVYAPVVSWADAGSANICINGKQIGKIPLVYGDTVEQKPEEEKSFFNRLLKRN